MQINVYIKRLICAILFLSSSLHNIEYDVWSRNYHYWRANKNSAVHKEVLRHKHDDGIIIRIEQPVILAGEEYLVEDSERNIKIYRNQKR